MGHTPCIGPFSMAAPEGSAAQAVTATAHSVGVEIDVSRTVTRINTEVLRLLNDLSQQGLPPDEIASGLRQGLLELSDAPIDRAARGATGEAFNLGRNLEAQRQVEQIQEVIRSEILDTETCQPCKGLDFSKSKKVYTVNSPEYFEDMPPNHCKGQEQCRGFYVYRVAA